MEHSRKLKCLGAAFAVMTLCNVAAPTAADIVATNFADDTLIGWAPGPNGIWGDDDDVDVRALPPPDARPAYNPLGSASVIFVDTSAGDPLDVGSLTSIATVDPSTLRFTSLSIDTQAAGFGFLVDGSSELDPSRTSFISIDGSNPRHHSQNLFLQDANNVSNKLAVSSDGYSIFNGPGLDSPDASWDDFYESNLLYFRSLANSRGLNWQEIGVELFDLGSDPSGNQYGIIAVNVSLVPIPAAMWLLGSALVGLAAIGRRRLSSPMKRES